MRKKVRLSLVILICFMLTMPGCMHNNAQNIGSLSEASEKIELVMYYSSIGQYSTDSPIANMLKERFNITFRFEPIPFGETADVWLKTKIASGVSLDYMSNIKSKYYVGYAKQGIFCELPLDLIEAHAPRMKEWIEDEVGFDVWKYFDIDGKNYAIPELWSLGPKWESMAIREDWLNEVGIDKLPTTLDEMELAFDKFKNVLNKPYAFNGIGLASLNWVFGAYGVYPFIFTEKDSVITRGEVEPAAKEALTTLNRWYQKGYIDPEFLVQKPDVMLKKWEENQFGAVQTCWSNVIPGGLYYDNLLGNDPNAVVTQIRFPAGPGGSSGIVQTNPIWSGFCFGKHLENNIPKLKKYLEFFDYCSQDSSAKELLTRGVENVTFKYTEDNYTFIPPYDNIAERIKFGINIPIAGNFNNYKISPYQSTAKSYASVENLYAINGGKYDILQPIPRPIYAEKGKQLSEFTMLGMIDFITGNRPLDEFDSFVQDWFDSMGGRDILEEAQGYYDLYKTK